MTPDRREVILLAGMHRSGTSALARLLNLSGAEIPGSLLPPSIYNTQGYWESEEVLRINSLGLAGAGLDWNTIFENEPAWYETTSGYAFLCDLRHFVGTLKPSGPPLLIKDPRISLFAAGWRRVLSEAGFTPKFVIAYRDPSEVAASLTSRQLHIAPDSVWPSERGAAIWLNYLLCAEKGSRGAARSFVSYHAVLADWRGELDRIGSDLELHERLQPKAAEVDIESFLSKDLRIARAQPLDESSLYARMLDLLGRANAQPDHFADEFDAIHATFQTARDVLGDFIAHLEARETRMDWRDRIVPSRPRPASAPADAADTSLRVRHDALLKTYAQHVASAVKEREEAVRLQQRADTLQTQQQVLVDRLNAAMEQVSVSTAALSDMERANRHTQAALDSSQHRVMQLEAGLQQSNRDHDAREHELRQAFGVERAYQDVETARLTSRLREEVVAEGVANAALWRERLAQERTVWTEEVSALLTLVSEQRVQLEERVEEFEKVKEELQVARLWATTAKAAQTEESGRCSDFAAEIDHMLRSKSWRLTRPLRAMRRRLGAI